MKDLSFTVPPEYSGAQVKTFLRRGCGVSAKLLSQCKKMQNGILKHGKPVWAADTAAAGDTVRLTLPQEHNSMAPEALPVSVLWEDDALLILNKPPQMPVHPCPGHDRGTVCNFVSYYQKRKGEDWRFRPLNRLDKDTSGLVIGAKDSYAASALNDVGKTYFAVCQGSLPGEGVIDTPIRLKEGHSIQREAGEGGKPAVTHWKSLAQGAAAGKSYTLLALTLETGRTHQIRVHLSSIGHPLAGDDFYGGSRELISRQALHCGLVELTHPFFLSRICVKAPFPNDFKKILEFLNIHNQVF